VLSAKTAAEERVALARCANEQNAEAVALAAYVFVWEGLLKQTRARLSPKTNLRP
jgi:hypothetical protein